jgi:hypothetical protein
MHAETQCGDGSVTPQSLKRRLDLEWVNYELLMHREIDLNAWAVLLVDHNKRYFSGVVSPDSKRHWISTGLWMNTRNAHGAVSHYMGILSDVLRH